MKGKNTISTFELFELFPDQESARIYLEGRLWPEGVRCSCCGMTDRITARNGCPVRVRFPHRVPRNQECTKKVPSHREKLVHIWSTNTRT